MVLFETIITIRGGVDDLFQVISFNIYELSNSAHQILRICWLLDAGKLSVSQATTEFKL